MSNPMITALSSLTALRLSGEKVQTFLQGQLTCEMTTLSEHGKNTLAACCDHRGRMLANFWAINWQNDFLFILPKNVCETVEKHLSKFAVFSKVSIKQDDHFFIAELTDFSDNRLNGIVIPLPSEKRHLLICEENPFPEINICTDETQWRKNNIADQLAILCDKTSLLFTPQMINLEKLGGVSFTKGCYVGQEIIARTQHLGTLKRHLHRLTIHENQQPGDTLSNEKGDHIGIIIDSIAQDNQTFDALAVIEDRYIA